MIINGELTYRGIIKGDDKDRIREKGGVSEEAGGEDTTRQQWSADLTTGDRTIRANREREGTTDDDKK